MDNSPIPNFITRKTAAERCQCAERSLQRYWSRAIELRDVSVLENLKLRTEDGEITDGPGVTKKLIDDLKMQGRNPTWYAHATWVEKTYGPRSANAAEPDPGTPRSNTPRATATTTKPATTDADAEIVAILKEQLRQSQESHQEDKRAFREQIAMLKEMFDTLKEDHSDTKDLLKEVHKVFGSVSQAYLSLPRNPAAESMTKTAPSSEPSAHESIIEVEPAASPEKGDAESAASEPSSPVKASKQNRPASKPAATATTRRKKPAKTEPPSEQRPRPRWYEMPTFKRLLTRSNK